MTETTLPFSGRIIFDHQPKTAGQAINAWLRATLGSGTVTDNLIGSHRELILRYAGDYPIISGHVGFNGTDIDRRYRYVTCLREPVDRALSHLFFMVNNHTPDHLDNWHLAKQFLDSDGAAPEDVALLGYIRNIYVEHFTAIDGPSPQDANEKLAKALANLERYDVWGFYESMPEFLADFASLLGVPAPGNIARVNVTRQRSPVDRISPALRRRLEDLNALDIEFYRIIRERYPEAGKRWQRPAITAPQWARYEQPAARIFSAPEFALIQAKLNGSANRNAGNLLSFSVDFSLAQNVSELEIGIHILDAGRRWAFGTNTTLLAKVYKDIPAGTHRLHYVVVAYLPEGSYTAGFAFAERLPNGQIREIAWYDKLVEFRITALLLTPSVGYVSLPVTVDCYQVSQRIAQRVVDGSGCAEIQTPLSCLRAGETVRLPAILFNNASQDWNGWEFNPLNLSYHWLDTQGHTVVFDGERTPLPEEGVAAGGRVAVALTVRAPDQPGLYRLRVVPVQEGHLWFDDVGFVPADWSVEVSVHDDVQIDEIIIRRSASGEVDGTPALEDGDTLAQPVSWSWWGSHPRILSDIGVRVGRQMVATGKSGHLVYGPYINLPAGNYQARVQGSCAEDSPAEWLAQAYMDVAWNKGEQHTAPTQLKRTNLAGTGWIAVSDVIFDTAAEDVEFRIWISHGCVDFRVDAITLELHPDQGTSQIPFAYKDYQKSETSRD